MIMIMNSNDKSAATATTTTTTTEIKMAKTTTININDQQSQQHQNKNEIIITNKELGELLNYFSSSSSSPYRNRDYNSDSFTSKIEEKCIRLLSKDYKNLLIISNDRGQLSTSYPSKIVIPQIDINNHDNKSNNDQSNDSLLFANNHLNKLYDSDAVDNDFIINENNDEVDNLSSILNENLHFNHKNNHHNGNNKNVNEKFDVNKLNELITKARVARCRARFPIPVILFKNKYICRSATLSSAPEIFGRSVFDFTFNDKKNSRNAKSVKNNFDSNKNSFAKNHNDDNIVVVEDDNNDDDFVQANHNHKNGSSPTASNNMPLNIADSTKLFTHFRNQDIKLLKYLNVKLICDLMLEKKKVKFGMNVTSSEKADKKNRYSDFNLLSLPYPGCEFFREYRDNSYSGEGLIYDWNQDFVDAEFNMQNSIEISKILNLNFKEYRSWDVIQLTQNYMKIMLYFLKEFDSSLLIHCISGWDRTPLFISLLRLTLWADGQIHKSLNAVEICYLTVAYDWLLFGHNLNDRLSKGEEIMFFCFQFLKFIIGDEFAIDHIQPEQTNGFHKNDETNIAQDGRKISTDSFTLFDDFILENIPSNGTTNTSSSIGSSSSLSRNRTAVNNVNNTSIHKSEDSYSLGSTFEFEQHSMTNNNTVNDQIETNESMIMNISEPPPEMIATLTLDDVDDTVNHFGSPPKRNDSFTNNNDDLFTDNCDLHSSSTQPVRIPNANNNNGSHHHKNIDNDHHSNSLTESSLCRSDSWQFVSEASSIIDNNSLLNQHFSSPESFSSFSAINNNYSANNHHYLMNGAIKKCNSPVNLPSSSSSSVHSNGNKNHIDNNDKPKRAERLLEVRSLFNSAYMSINFHRNNGNSAGGIVTNFMDQLYRTVNI